MIKNVIKSVFSSVALTYLLNLSVTSIFPIIFVIIAYFIFDKGTIENSISIKLCSLVFCIFVLLSLFQINVYEEILVELKMPLKVLKIAFILIGTYFTVELFLSTIYKLFDSTKNIKNKVNSKKLFLLSFVTLIVIYLPMWLAQYPSIIGADTFDQINQILSNSYTNHHPFLHTIWLKLLMTFGNDINQKVGIASLIQLVLNVFVFSCVIVFIYKITDRLLLSICTWCFYGLASFHSSFSIILMKDTTHATITLLLLCSLVYYFKNEKKKHYLLVVFLLSILFCLVRTNGYYAFVVFLVIVLINGLRERRFQLFICVFLAFIFSTIIKGPLYKTLQISEASYAEKISIPLQQIAFVNRYGYAFTDEQNELLNKIIDVSKMGENYEFFLSDPIKRMLNASGNVTYLEEHLFDYFKVWLQIGLKYPILYLRAWVDQVSTFFYPTYYGTSVFYGVENNSLGITSSPIIEGKICDEMLKLAQSQYRIPVIGWVHYPAITTWILFAMLFYANRNKDKKSIIILSLLIGIWMTIMISCPYNICFRYYYSVVCCLPIIVLYPIINKAKEKENE